MPLPLPSHLRPDHRLVYNFSTAALNRQQPYDRSHHEVRFTSEMRFLGNSPEQRTHCFRVLDESGHSILSHTFPQLSREVAVKMYKDMATIQIMDNIFFVAQRHGRISFYLTSDGEEAISVATAAAHKPNDVVLPQYRGFYYGVDSPCKNLRTSVLGMRRIMGMEGKCLFIMDRGSTKLSLCSSLL